jgi:His/Glu/Gln/Arg/opine family amino acid ABC transporter permease subunit
MTVALLEWLGTSRNLEFILEGFLINLEIAIVAIVLSLVFGLLLALVRLSRLRPLSIAAGIWVDTFRNLPLIFLLLFLALWLPGEWRDWWTEAVPDWAPSAYRSGFVLAAFLGLTLYNSAVLAEIMRAGILSLPRGQQEAAAALGMSYRQQMRHVILPQGLRRMVPATVGQLITLNKDTTLVSIIAIQEVMRNGRTVAATSGNPFVGGGEPAPILEVFLVIGVLFVAVNFTLSRLSRRLEVRERRRSGAKAAPVSGLEDQVVV